MATTYQLHFNLSTHDQIKKSWAFAKDHSGKLARKKRRSIRDYSNCVITACSKEARIIGVRAGMRYEEAKTLVPDLKVLVIGDRV